MSKGKSPSEFLRPMATNPLQSHLGRGLHTLGLLGWILEQTGPADVYVSTFSTSDAFLRGFYNLKKKDMVLKSVLLADLKASKKTRPLFAYVPQGNFLISGSIRDVVSLYGMKGCMTVEEACRIACAREYIENLPEKYDTMLGERGVGLSEGQMQRLAIARAIYMGAPVLLLDEATSALDGNTEAQVLKNIRALEGKTVIIVTHRPAALDICNRRIEIKDKKIVI